MNKEDILHCIQLEIESLASDLTPDNADTSLAVLQDYAEAYRKIQKLSFACSGPGINDTPALETYDELREVYDEKNNVFIGRARMQLGGAEFGRFGIYIPETIIRRLLVEEGDWVKAKVISTRLVRGVSKPVYEYEILEKADPPQEPQRKVARYSIVEYDDDLNEIYLNIPQNNSMPAKVLLPPKRCGNLTPDIGDLVDYAWEGDRILDGRIIWRHTVDFDIESAPKPSGFYKTRESADNGTPDPVLDGVNVLIAGYESNKNAYREAVESRNGSFCFVTGDEKPETLAAEIATADIVVVFFEYIGHGGMYHIRSTAKEQNIPILFTRAVGRDMLVRLITEKLAIVTEDE